MMGVSRPPPKLRTLTGCFMCRKRRKKCDERKPQCSGCARQNFRCVWPAPENVTENDMRMGENAVQRITPTESKDIPGESSSPFSDDSTKIGLVRSASYGLPGITTSTDHYLSLHLRERFLPGLLRANAHPFFQDWRPLITMGTETPPAMGALLATAAMHASWMNPKLKLVATRYYNSVIKDLRKAIVDGKVDGSEDWVLHTTNFLCLFEISQGWNTGHNPSGAAPHLGGLARILNIRIAKDLKQSKGLVHPQNRIAAESLVLFTSTLSLYYSDVDCVNETINWDGLSRYLEPEVFPGASTQANSPLLGSNWKLHRTIFEVVRLSHTLPLDSSSWAHGRELELELRRREYEVRGDMEKMLNSTECFEDVLQQTLLYILVTQILIFKTLRPETRTCDPDIRQIVADAMEIVRRLTIGPECGPFFCWPLAILSCAIKAEDDFSTLRDTLEKVWLMSYCGEVQRVRNVAEASWESVDKGCNLLDLLVYRGGLFKHPSLKSGWGKPL